MSRPDTIVIAGRAYRWRDIVELRRQQIAAWKATRPEQPALFALKAYSAPLPSRPSSFTAIGPGLIACSGSTGPRLSLQRPERTKSRRECDRDSAKVEHQALDINRPMMTIKTSAQGGFRCPSIAHGKGSTPPSAAWR